MSNDVVSKFQIKGIKDGLLVMMGDGNWPDQLAALIHQVDGEVSFFQGARLTLDVGNQILHAAELGSLRDLLSERNITLWAVLSNSPTTEQNARTLGMATRLPTPRPDRTMRTLDTNLSSGDEAIFIRKTLRSGFKVTHPGHIVVLGDVNPGAELIAGGSIVVWGKLRGVIHAGAEGKEDAVVCALDLSPTQLRIAGQIAIPPKRRGKPQPEIASIQNGQVVAEPWNPKG